MAVVRGSPFGGPQTEADFVLKLRPQSRQPGGHLLPPLFQRPLPPRRPLPFGSHPASSPEQAEAGEVGSPAAPGKEPLVLVVCVSRSLCVCVFFFLPSFGFKLGTGAYTLSRAESTSSQRAGSAVPRQAQPHFRFGASAHTPWLPPHLPPLASLPDPTSGWANGLGNECLCARFRGVCTQRCPTAPVAELHSLSLKPQPDISTKVIITSICGALPTCQTLG